jgi:hypothetical protein
MEVRVAPELRGIARDECERLQKQSNQEHVGAPASFEQCVDNIATFKTNALNDYLAVCELRLGVVVQDDLREMHAKAETLLCALQNIITNDTLS